MGIAHENVVPVGTITLGGLLTGMVSKVIPLHMVKFWFGIKGSGFTRIVTMKGVPVQLPCTPEVGVTEYVAVWERLVGLNKDPLIEAWLFAAVPPVIPPVTTGAAQL